MKKLFTILLSLLMVVTITGMNVLAGAKLGGDANVDIEVIGNEAMTDDKNVDESKVNKVYAVDIGWSSGFKFTYKFNANKPTYSPDTLKYTQAADANEGWYANGSATKKDTIAFTVTNRSNNAVVVTPEFKNVDLTGTTALEVNDGTTTFANTAGTKTSFKMAKASVTELGKAGTAVVKNLTMKVAGIPTYAANESKVRAKLHLDIAKDETLGELKDVITTNHCEGIAVAKGPEGLDLKCKTYVYDSKDAVFGVTQPTSIRDNGGAVKTGVANVYPDLLDGANYQFSYETGGYCMTVIYDASGKYTGEVKLHDSVHIYNFCE